MSHYDQYFADDDAFDSAKENTFAVNAWAIAARLQSMLDARKAAQARERNEPTPKPTGILNGSVRLHRGLCAECNAWHPLVLVPGSKYLHCEQCAGCTVAYNG